MKSKRKFVIIATLILLLGIAFIIGSPYVIGNSFNDLLKTNSSNITKVFMRKGMSYDCVSTTDKVKIQEIVQLLGSRRYTKALNQETRYGYTYSYEIYVENEKAITIVGSGDNVEINGTYYDVDKQISTDGLTKWFDSLPVTEWPDSTK
jgi:hypothetical protein